MTDLAGGWIGLLSLCVYTAFCSVGYANQPWTVCGEIFPTNLKNTAIAITSLVNWGANYGTASWFMTMTDGEAQMGKIVMYGIMGTSCLVAFGFTYRYLPETKDKQLDDCVEMVRVA